MKILAVSDVEVPQMQDCAYLRRTYPDVQLLISCGDMQVHYLDFIGTSLNVPLLFVRGNHDTTYVPPDPGGDNLHQRMLTHGGFTFAGLEGSIRYGPGAIQYSQQEMWIKVLRLTPRLWLRHRTKGYGVDVLVTHSPPKGIHDLPDDFAHRGFRSFLFLLRVTCPRFMIHGHVDTWDNRKPRTTQFGRTTIHNINPYMVLDLNHA